MLDLWRGGLSYRRLWVLIKHLPTESWTQTALRDSEATELVSEEGPRTFGPWSLENYQLAGLTDAVNALRYVTAVVAGAQEYPQPDPTPRPGIDRPKRLQTHAAVDYLKSLRAKG